MRYCVRCLYPENHPLNITFDAEGVCSGCRVHEEKDSLDWKPRFEKLKTLTNTFRNHSSNKYDCIVPVNGARDSYFIVHTVKNVLGLNPLLVSYNRHFNTVRGQRNLAYLKTLFNCDAIEMVVAPQKVKKISRATLTKMGSFYWPVLAGQTVFPVQAAVRFKVPLIIWGHHQGLDQVGMFSHEDEVEMTRKYRKEHDLMGYEAEDVEGIGGLSAADLTPYVYPHDKELEKVGVRGIYLGNYIRWDTKLQHEQMIARFSYESFPQQRTFDTYNDVDCQHYSATHDLVKYYKWGYGKVLDHACREIRFKRLSREAALDLVKQYEQKQPVNLNLLLDWLQISERDFFATIDAFRDPKVWLRQGNQWTRKTHVSESKSLPGVDKAGFAVKEDCVFQVTPNRAPKVSENEVPLLHKGYVNRTHVAEGQA